MSIENNRVSDLVSQIYEAIAKGRKSIVIHGVNQESLAILAALHSAGLNTYVSALLDDRKELAGSTYSGITVRALHDLPLIPMDVLVVSTDAKKEDALEEIASITDRQPILIYAGEANYEFRGPALTEIIKSCPVKSKAGGYPNMLVHLYQALENIANKGLPGDIAEFGVFQGGTTVIMAKILQHFGCAKKIYGFDTFSGFPQRKSILDNYSDEKCEFRDFETVAAYCAPYNIQLIQGDICETHTEIDGIPLALSFFDTDNYSATRVALEACWKQTVPGGVLAFDHYYSPGWNKTIGERIAIRQVLADKGAFNLHGTGIFLKT